MSTNEGKAKTGIFSGTRRYLSDVKGELKKVVWPSKKQVVNNTIVVMVVVAIAGVVIGGFDFLLSTVVNMLFSA